MMIEFYLEFIQSNSIKPAWPHELLKQFLTALISSPEMIFEMREEGRLVALGVLLDRVKNSENLANLEVLGIEAGQDFAKIFDQILIRAKKVLPLTESSGFQIGFHNSFKTWTAEIVLKHRLLPHYESFVMVNSDLQMHAKVNPKLSLIDAQDYVELYRLTEAAFRENPDTSVPEFSDWLKARSDSERLMTWVLRENGKMVAYLNLAKPNSDEKAEIRTVGVLKEFRGRGIGKSLLQHAFSYLGSHAISECELTVSVQNQNALWLYQGLGFEKIESYSVYRWVK